MRRKPTPEEALAEPPIDRYLRWLGNRPEPVDFVILYGSRARGDAKRHSDYDLLIGLGEESPKRYIDRLEEFVADGCGEVEAKPLTPSEVDNLWWHLGRTLLDPLYEGIVLRDQGPWGHWRTRFKKLMDSGILERDRGMWIWHRKLDPDLRLRLDKCGIMSPHEAASSSAAISP